jgi:hypothetical protein
MTVGQLGANRCNLPHGYRGERLLATAASALSRSSHESCFPPPRSILGDVKKYDGTQRGGAKRGRTNVASGSGFSLFVDILARHAIRTLSRRLEQTVVARADHYGSDVAEVKRSVSLTEPGTSRDPVPVASTADTSSLPETRREVPSTRQVRLFD